MLSQRLKGARIAAAAKVAQLEYRTVVSSTANLTSYTFSSVDIGTASSDRLIIAIVHVVAVGGTITNLTIAGVSAARQIINTNANIKVAIYTALVPTGTTGTISVTTDVAATNITISTYTLKNYNSSAPENVATATGTPTATINLTFGSNGAVVAGSISGSASTTTSWSSPLVENYDIEIEDRPRSGASASGLPAQTLSVSATVTPSSNSELVAAAWR